MKHEFDPFIGLFSLHLTYFCNFKASKSKFIVMQMIKIAYLNNRTNLYYGLMQYEHFISNISDDIA